MIPTTRALLATSLLVVSASAQTPPESALHIPTYTAQYDVEYKGRKLGESRFTLEYDAARQRYRFDSSTSAVGLAKLLRPRPAVERGEFVVRGGEIRPDVFEFEDGSRKGEDNHRIAFDWEAGSASITSDDGVNELLLQPGVLDRATLQVALMRDLARGEGPGPYLLADEDSLKTYRYAVAGRETVTTPAGRYETVMLRQQREGSSRETLIWAAPELRYLPVRIEQRRDGEVVTALMLTDAEGLRPVATADADE